MFSSTLRSQAARLGLRTAVRAAAAPAASRSLSALVAGSRQTSAMLPALTRLVASRAFSRSAVVAFEDRPQSPPSQTLFVGNLPWSATKEELFELFGQFGDVANVRLQTHVDGRPRGFAHVEFGSKEHAIACVTSASEEPLHFGGRDLVLDYARDKRTDGANFPPANRLYFAKFTEGEAALRETLENHADKLVSIYYMKDGNTGEELSSGFLEFTDIASATEALTDLNGAQTPSGDTLMLQYARPKRVRTDGGNRGGFGADRGGYGGADRGGDRGGYGGGNRGGDRGGRGGYGGGGGGGGNRSFNNDRSGGGGDRESYSRRSYGGSGQQSGRDSNY